VPPASQARGERRGEINILEMYIIKQDESILKKS
jgi:hypothetical protein